MHGVESIAQVSHDNRFNARIIAFCCLPVSTKFCISATARDLWLEHHSGDYLLLINLHVLSLVYLGLWIAGRINLSKALSFSPPSPFWPAWLPDDAGIPPNRKRFRTALSQPRSGAAISGGSHAPHRRPRLTPARQGGTLFYRDRPSHALAGLLRG